MKIDTNIIILFIALIIVAIISFIIRSIKSKNTYLLYLKASLPTVAENIIENILSDEEGSITINDIFDFESQYMLGSTDIYVSIIELVKHKMLLYIQEYIESNIHNQFIKKLLGKVTKDSDIILDAIDVTLLSNDSKLYNKLIKLIYDHLFNWNEEVEKEEKEAAKIAEDYENETVENVPEYNGELDKSEFDIARENFEPTGAEYPEEENLDEIPEELIEIVAMSEEDEK